MKTSSANGSVTGQKLPPGAKTALWSFNHDTGVWEIQGSMTITPDGNFAVTDPGVGVRQPGWHGTQPGSQGGGGPPPTPPSPPDQPTPCPPEPPKKPDGTACYTVKDGACLKALDDCLQQLLSKVCDCYANPPRLNHGNDGSHSNNSRHYSNMAVDFSGVDFGDGDRYTTDESLAIAKCIQQFDMGGIFTWMAQLGGLKNIKKFRVQVMPNQQALQMAQAGNIIPMGGPGGPGQAGQQGQGPRNFELVPEPAQIPGMGATG